MKRTLYLALISLLMLASGFSQAQTLTTDTVIQTSPCKGAMVIVKFTASGFGSGNKFTVQLSDRFGQFTTATNIGSTSFSFGFMSVKFPDNALAGMYKIRVVASNPVVTSLPAPNSVYYLGTIPQLATITASPDSVVCLGDTATLTVIAPNQTYLWSTGETTQSIKVTAAGSYHVKLTDVATCVNYDTINVSTKICPAGIADEVNRIAINAAPNPFSEQVVFNSPEQPFDNASLLVYNHQGALVRMETHLQGTAYTLERKSLSAGLYFYTIEMKRGVMKRGKLVVE